MTIIPKLILVKSILKMNNVCFTSIYMTIRVDIEYPSNCMSENEATEIAVEEFDYNFKLPKDTNIKVVDSEICGVNE